eukprot:815817-Lingulodinium_polyedra.AAC.1
MMCEGGSSHALAHHETGAAETWPEDRTLPTLVAEGRERGAALKASRAPNFRDARRACKTQ